MVAGQEEEEEKPARESENRTDCSVVYHGVCAAVVFVVVLQCVSPTSESPERIPSTGPGDDDDAAAVDVVHDDVADETIHHLHHHCWSRFPRIRIDGACEGIAFARPCCRPTDSCAFVDDDDDVVVPVT